MKWITKLNEAMEYLECHLTEELDYEILAQKAGCSSFHFQRMFSYLAEVPLSEYIRRRKMSCAAVDLQGGKMSVLEVSLKYGYDSPTAFNRAFQNVHGVAPSISKKDGVPMKSFPPIEFQLAVKGDVPMEYRVETKDSFRIIGIREKFKINIEENFLKVPEFWMKTAQEGHIPNLLVKMNQEPYGLLGVSSCMNGEDFEYYIGVSSNYPKGDEWAEYEVPSCTWAIFTCVGKMPEAIQILQRKIITQWLPNSGYEYDDAPDIELYFDGDQQSETYLCEVWLPVRKKMERE